MSGAPSISVIVPARDAAATIERTLACLAAQDLAPVEVIVVDDASQDATPAIAERAGARVVSVSGAGPADARNAGAAAASGDVLAFTDADCFPAPGWLRAAAAALDGADLVQGRVAPDPAASPGPFDRTLHVDGEHGLYESANLVARRELFDRLGGFEDWLTIGSGKPLAEDVWFGWRARRSGARTAFSGEALVHHAVFARGIAGYVSERRRVTHFPAIVRRVPELRRELLVARVFLNRRTAALDLAAASAAVAAVSGFLPALAGIAPYGAMLGARALRWGRLGPRVIAGDLAADVVGLAALLAGSARSRSLVL